MRCERSATARIRSLGCSRRVERRNERVSLARRSVGAVLVSVPRTCLKKSNFIRATVHAREVSQRRRYYAVSAVAGARPGKKA
jgi:hypothetical protein